MRLQVLKKPEKSTRISPLTAPEVENIYIIYGKVKILNRKIFFGAIHVATPEHPMQIIVKDEGNKPGTAH